MNSNFYLFIFSFVSFCEIAFATCPEILIELFTTLMSYSFPMRFRFRFHGEKGSWQRNTRFPSHNLNDS